VLQAHVDYYSQRASLGGLLITEACNISPEAMGYISVPGAFWHPTMSRSYFRAKPTPFLSFLVSVHV
jgi:2,4-dienoyl-CoA reductase-like NADH-dependent reductase (Old Yellow Enzyme family)